MIRRDWDELPQNVRTEISRRCGRVTGTEPATAGRNSEFAATLHLQDSGSHLGDRVFVKGITADHPAAATHRREAEVNEWLPAVAPRLRWMVEADGWLMLGFEHVSGRHADLSPGSPDLQSVARSVSTLATALTPCPAPNMPALVDQWTKLASWRRLRKDTPDDLDPWSRTNLDRFVEWEQHAIDLVDGKSLLHTDLQSLNIMMDPAARVVDWAWSRTGAPWVDTAFMVLRLIDAGHAPDDAERWANTISVWNEASETARTAFSISVLGIWEFLERDHPLPHRKRLTDVARQWAQHRLTLDLGQGCQTSPASL